MTDQANQPFEKKEQVSVPEQEALGQFQQEKKGETKERVEDDRRSTEALRREIELMQADPALQEEAQTKAKKIQILAEDEKLQELVKIAREKGVVVAIKTAQSMNDPYMLDMLHDLLAKEGYYKQFAKQ
jgi:RecB family endonuclease NucS